MALAATVEEYLKTRDVPYEVLSHPHTPNSIKTASAADVSARRLAKAVVLEDENGYLMAVLPADCRVQIGRLRERTGRNVGLATEGELASLFADCEVGAIPPLGIAYGMETIVDDELAEQPEIFFEAGDHEGLIRMKTADFMRLLTSARHGHFVTR